MFGTSNHRRSRMGGGCPLGGVAVLAFALSLALAPAIAHADPVISGLNTTQGSLGSNVIIYGTGFGATQGESYVTLGGQMVPVVSWSDLAIFVSLSGLDTTTLNTGTALPLVVVVMPDNKSSNAIQFTLSTPSTGSLTVIHALQAEQLAAQFYTVNAGKSYLTATTVTNPGTTTPAPTETNPGTTTPSPTVTNPGTTTPSPTTPTAAPEAATSTNVTALKSMVDEMSAVHSAHVNSLQQALGVSAPAAPSFQSLDAPTLAQFLTMAQSIEDFAAGTQQGVVLSMMAGTAAPAGGTAGALPSSIGSTEAAILADDSRFAGAIRAFRKAADTADGGDPNTTITESGAPFNVALTTDQVLTFQQRYLGTTTTPGTTTPGTETGTTGTGTSTPMP